MTPRIRCAVYTRKSSEEGLEQSFNSLHAQREACEAFIRSQKHEGWALVTTSYDDGGFSGGNMDRPALRALMADIGVDCGPVRLPLAQPGAAAMARLRAQLAEIGFRDFACRSPQAR